MCPARPPSHTHHTAPQSNFLGHFELTNALVSDHQRQRQQQRQAPSSHPLRVVLLSSMTHYGADLSDLSDVPYCRKRWHSFQAYCDSKLCTLLAAKHLDRLFAR